MILLLESGKSKRSTMDSKVRTNPSLCSQLFQVCCAHPHVGLFLYVCIHTHTGALMYICMLSLQAIAFCLGRELGHSEIISE